MGNLIDGKQQLIQDVNRRPPIDSTFELDDHCRPCQLYAMPSNTIPFVILDRHDPSQNMARYYVLSIEPSLFGDTALVRQWGRQGRRGRQRVELFRQRAQAIETLDAWFARKMRRGYVPRNNSLAPHNAADEEAKSDPEAAPVS
jgi:predicted DNA-binding WGR domain protein